MKRALDRVGIVVLWLLCPGLGRHSHLPGGAAPSRSGRHHGRQGGHSRAARFGRGQNVWQSMGGMEVGSIWGHGSYVAPDWTADWLHRECVFILDDWARSEHGHQGLRRARGGAAGRSCEKRLRTAVADEHLRPRHAERSQSNPCGPGRSRRTSRTTPTCSPTASAEYAIPRGTVSDPDTAAAAWPPSSSGPRGRVDEPPGRHHHLHEQLAARAARSATGPPARPSSGPA